MGFNLTHLQYFILFIFVYTLNIITTVFAATNVTIVYQDPSITYSPPGAWSLSAPSKLDLGGAHMMTQNPNATASFNFTGKFSFSLFLFFILLLFSCTVKTRLISVVFLWLYLFHLSRHSNILFSSIVALSRQYSGITRFWAYHSNRFSGSHCQFSEYRSRPRDSSISSRLECYWFS